MIRSRKTKKCCREIGEQAPLFLVVVYFALSFSPGIATSSRGNSHQVVDAPELQFESEDPGFGWSTAASGGSGGGGPASSSGPRGPLAGPTPPVVPASAQQQAAAKAYDDAFDVIEETFAAMDDFEAGLDNDVDGADSD